MKRLSSLIVLLSLALLAACHSYKKENVQPPTPLDKHFKPTVEVKKLWSARVGKGAGQTGVRMRPAYAEGVLYAASPSGDIAAFDARTGKKLWSRHTRMRGWFFGLGNKHYPDAYYSGGPSIDGGQLVVGTLDGHVYDFDPKTGKQRWRSELSAEVISPPAIVSDQVLVRCEDGRIYSLDVQTGARRWVNDQGDVPLLSLRGNGSLLVANGVVFLGSDDGKLIALRLDNGEKLWELTLASGEGRTDIERLNDADTMVSLDGRTLYAGAFHGDLMAVDGPSGRPLWGHPFSTFVSPTVGVSTIFGVDDTSQVWSFDKSSGSDVWKNDALKYRWVSAPAEQGDYIVLGDLQGYVHWLKASDGALVGRARLSKQAIHAQPLVVGQTAYIEDIGGHIAAYQLAVPARGGKP